MISHVARLAREADVIDRVVVVHADLGRVEWPGTSELAEAQAQHFGLRFMRVSRVQGDLLQHIEKLGKFPMPTQRFCTADHKRAQIYRAFTMLADDARDRLASKAAAEGCKFTRPIRILNCVGLRAEESPGRAKRPEIARDPKPSGRRKVVHTWLPIQGWTEAEVWAACRASGAPMHPAYAAGLPRASCVFCIYAPESALQVAGLAHPALLAEYVAVEARIGHTFKRHLSLATVQWDLTNGVRPGKVKSWAM